MAPTASCLAESQEEGSPPGRGPWLLPTVCPAKGRLTRSRTALQSTWPGDTAGPFVCGSSPWLWPWLLESAAGVEGEGRLASAGRAQLLPTPPPLPFSVPQPWLAGLLLMEQGTGTWPVRCSR